MSKPTTGAFTFKYDHENEGLHKMPRRGMWNWHSGDVMIRCPDCGGVSDVNNHQKLANILSPSVVCPHGCGFHTQPTTLDHYMLSPGELE